MKKYILGLVMIFCFFNCETDEPLGEVPPNNYESQLNVAVYTCDVTQDPFCDDKQPVPQLTVLIYPSNQARMYNDSLIAICRTSSQGICYFSGLTQPKHYVRIESNQLGDRDVSERTPSSTVTWLEVIYPE